MSRQRLQRIVTEGQATNADLERLRIEIQSLSDTANVEERKAQVAAERVSQIEQYVQLGAERKQAMQGDWARRGSKQCKGMWRNQDRMPISRPVKHPRHSVWLGSSSSTQLVISLSRHVGQS